MRKIILLILLPLLHLYAQDLDQDLENMSDKEIYKIIDTAIENRDREFVSVIGKINTSSSKYKQFEDYILDKASGIVDQDDLSYPLYLVESILYYNLESSKAQELYVDIVNKKIDIEERASLEEEREELKREIIETLAEDIEEEATKQEELSEIVEESKTLTEKRDSYFDGYNKLRYNSNSFIYPISYSYFSSEVYDEFSGRESTTNTLSGMGYELGLGIIMSYLNLRMDLSGNFAANDIFDNRKHITTNICFSFGTSAIPFPLFLRVGFFHDIYTFEEGSVTEMAITNLPSPTLGISVTGFKLFKVLKFDFSVDSLLASTYTDNFDSGLFTRLYTTVNLYRFDSYNVELRFGFDSIWLSEGGLTESSINPRFGFGVSSYE